MVEATGDTEKRPLVPNAIHLVRTSLAANLQLSQMADQKANMLMGAAFVVFTLAVGQLRTGTMIVPITILATGAFLAATCAIISVLPKVTHIPGPIGEDANIMFFGVFTSLSEQEFADRIVAKLDNDEALYRVMLRDIYQNGQVLQHKKYRYLGYAYRLFLTGLVLSFAAFAVEVAIGGML
ncbi:MAG: Pycsar system effector family protein [Sphingobium sp.]